MDKFQSRIFQIVSPYYKTILRDSFKELFETKHLYQNLHIEEPDRELITQNTEEPLRRSTGSINGLEDIVDFIQSSFSCIKWVIINPSDPKTAGYHTNSSEIYQTLMFDPPSLKLYCSNCKRTEAYNFICGFDLLKNASGLKDKDYEQVYAFTYQCQSCKDTPEIFIAYRHKLKINQCGRSPMEQFEIPTYIPKTHSKFFSDAIIAVNSGQILAGIFLLRTFIEQYVRSQGDSSNSKEIETIFTEYKDNLPPNFNSDFPSLYAIYGRLSNDLHNATGSDVLFFSAKKDIELHFRGKDVFSEVNTT